MNDTKAENIFSFKKNIRRFFIAPPSQMRTLDGLRALSIIFVVVFHCFYLILPYFGGADKAALFIDAMPVYLNWVWHGDKGVDMFFILSGFLIATIMMKEYNNTGEVNVRRFYLHRALRILPIYIFAMLLAAAARKGGGNAEYFWANLLFINNFFPAEKLFIPWSWSLTIEGQFYILFPLLFFFLMRTSRPLTLLVFLFLGATAIRYLVILLYPELYADSIYYLAIKGAKEGQTLILFDKLYINLYTRMGPLILGVTLAYLYIYRSEQIGNLVKKYPHRFNGLGLLALVLMITVTLVPVFNPHYDFGRHFNMHYLAWYRNLFALGVVTILFLAIFGRGVGRAFNWFLSRPFWYPIAQGSYSMYLFHIPIMGLAYLSLGEDGKTMSDFHPGIAFMAAALTLVYSLFFSLILYLLIERPFMNIYKRKQAARNA